MLHIFELRISLKWYELSFLAILQFCNLAILLNFVFLSGWIYVAELLYFHRSIILMVLLKFNIMSPRVAHSHNVGVKCKKTQMGNGGTRKAVKVHVSLHLDLILHAYRCFCFSNASNSSITLNDLMMDTSITSAESGWVAGREMAQSQKLLCCFLTNILLKWRWVRGYSHKDLSGGKGEDTYSN